MYYSFVIYLLYTDSNNF